MLVINPNSAYCVYYNIIYIYIYNIYIYTYIYIYIYIISFGKDPMFAFEMCTFGVEAQSCVDEMSIFVV